MRGIGAKVAFVVLVISAAGLTGAAAAPRQSGGHGHDVSGALAASVGPERVVDTGRTTHGDSYEVFAAELQQEGGGGCIGVRDQAGVTQACALGPLEAKRSLALNVVRSGEDWIVFPIVSSEVERIEVQADGAVLGAATAQQDEALRFAHVAVKSDAPATWPAADPSVPPRPEVPFEVLAIGADGKVLAREHVPAPPMDDPR